MPAAQTASGPIYCDGCTREATAEHLRSRIARLEWASRFRPIHIGTLLLMPAPPVAMEDFFYFPEGLPRDPEALALYEDLLESCGIAQSDKETRETSLRRFQEAGCFLAECVECPIGSMGHGEFDALLGRLTSTLRRRIQFSYRPKAILLISKRLSAVAEGLARVGLEARPLGKEGEPVSLPQASDIGGRERFRAELAAFLAGSQPYSL